MLHYDSGRLQQQQHSFSAICHFNKILPFGGLVLILKPHSEIEMNSFRNQIFNSKEVEKTY